MGVAMLVVNRFVVPVEGPERDDFVERATVALGALAARPGYVRGELGRAYDDPERWSLVTEWESVGAYRRALGMFDVKVHATPLLAQSLDEPSAYEVLARTDHGGTVTLTASDLATDNLTTGNLTTGNVAGDNLPGDGRAVDGEPVADRAADGSRNSRTGP